MRLLLAILLVLLPCAPLAADDLAELVQTNRLLRAEYELAKSQQLYFVIDLPAAQIHVRASGTTLAELPILSLRSWGRPADGIAYSLAKKTARKEPEREQVLIPGKEPERPAEPVIEAKKPAAPALQALEITDMPTDYVLQLDDGTLLKVQARLEEPSMWARARQRAARLGWIISRPLVSVWHHLRGSTHNEMFLILPEREARMLYWSFQEGARCLVRWP